MVVRKISDEEFRKNWVKANVAQLANNAGVQLKNLTASQPKSLVDFGDKEEVGLELLEKALPIEKFHAVQAAYVALVASAEYEAVIESLTDLIKACQITK